MKVICLILNDQLINILLQHLRWGIPNSKVGDQDLSFWKTNTEQIGSGDVDMRTTHAVSSVSDISHEV